MLGVLGSTSAMEDGSQLGLEVMRGRKEWYAVTSTTVHRWLLSGPVWKIELTSEIKFKKQVVRYQY